MYAGGEETRFRDEHVGSSVRLHCPCGATFSCRDSDACPGYCPWASRCGQPTQYFATGAAGPETTLRATCPACAAVRYYDRSGSAIAY